MNFTDGLNDAQISAVEHGDGPLLLLAGAGSGKTKTLTHRIAYLVAEKDVPSTSILAVTFTNKAAREMRERLANLLGKKADDRSFMPWMGTFHSICVRMLRFDGEQIGVPKNFVILDETDRLSFIKQVMKQLGVSEKNYTPRAIAGVISSAKNEGIGPSQYSQTATLPLQQVVADVYPRYERMKENAKSLDFDDLLNDAVRLLSASDEILTRWQQRFRYILVDEYQDTNKVQYQLIKLLSGSRESICVVGDDWQCFPQGSIVNTPTGQRKIESLKSNDLVQVASGYGKTHVSIVKAVKEYDYSGNLVNIKTKSGKSVTCTPNHLLFGRFEKMDKYLVYLMYAKGKGYRVGLAKAMRSDGRKDTTGLQIRANQERADRMWVLKVCDKRTEAQYFEAYYSYKYGLPMTLFHAFSNRSMTFDQHLIDRLYRDIDTKSRADLLMKDAGIYFDYPHFLPQAVTRGSTKRINVNVVLFGDKRISKTSSFSASRLSVNTTDPSVIEAFKDRGYSVRSAKSGTYRTEIHKLDFGEIEQILEEVEIDKNEINIGRYSFMTDQKFIFLPASQLHVGMFIAVEKDGAIVSDEIVEVVQQNYDGKVYDIDVSKVHNYIAEGVVVHNSIYSWRGADFTNILNFERDFPGATVIKLEKNYRSTKPILDAAHNVITKNKHRSDKNLTTDQSGGKPVQVIHVASEMHEAEAIVSRIKMVVDARIRPLNDFVVLYRTNAQSRAIEEAMMRYSVPYKMVGGTRFYDRAEVKDVLSYLRLLYQPSDRASFMRIINVPARGLGAVSVQRFLSWADTTDMNYIDALLSCDMVPKLTPRSRDSLRSLGQGLKSLHDQQPDLSLSKLIEKTIRKFKYLEHLDDGSIRAEDKQQNVKELVSDAEQRPDVDLQTYLEEVALVSAQDESSTQPGVTLMTLHAAKGLEFPVVFMAGMEEGLFPQTRALYDQNELEEERRLCYVGMTRAREELYLLTAESRLVFGSRQFYTPSRFLDDMEIALVDSSEAVLARPTTTPYEPHVVLDEESGIVPGDKVSHQLFGKGTVIEVDGTALKISFGVRGVKTLNAAFAPITKL